MISGDLRSLLFGACIPLIVSSCGTARTPARSGEQIPVVAMGHEPVPFDSVWPLKAGNTWEYEVEVAGDPPKLATYTLAADGYRDVEGGKLARVRVSKGKVVVDAGEFEVTRGGVRQVSSKVEPVAYHPPRTLLNLPFKQGSVVREIIVSPVIGSPEAVRQDIVTTTRGVEFADTNVGRMESQVVDSTSTYSVGSVKYTDTTTSYWVPRIGLVRSFHKVEGTNGSHFQETWRLTRQNISNP